MPKYNFKNQIVPQEKRKDINEKILYLLNNNLCEKYGITAEDIYNMYTGRGQTHDINFKDYNSYYAFSQEKKKFEEGEFFSPDNVIEFIYNCLKPNVTDLITDFTAGVGRFCNYAPVENNFYLNDSNINNIKIMKYLYHNAVITAEDIRNYKPSIKFDFVLGNPPYGIDFNGYKSEFYYCKKASELLKPLGILCIIVPNSFLNDEFSDKAQIQYMNDNFNFICQFDLPYNSFKSVGINNIETKVIFFQKKSQHVTETQKYSNTKISITELTQQNSDKIYNNYIRKLNSEKESLKAKLFYENLNNSRQAEDVEFAFKVQKLLFDIKRNPKIIKYYSRAIEYYNAYYNQKKPEDMDFSKWNEVRITEKKVIKYLKNILSKQHKEEKDIIRLVKSNYHLKLKGYSEKTNNYVTKLNNSCMSINDLILNNSYSFEDQSYEKLINKKRNEYLKQNQNFNSMELDNNIDSWLSSKFLYDYDNQEKFYLNEKQKHDINLALQKNYSYLAWETGSGKSLSSVFYSLYRMEYNNLRNTFIVAPAIAIRNTYEPMLESFKIPYIVIKNIEDIKNIKEGQFILITFNILSKNINKSKEKEIRLYRFIKKYIKQYGNNKFCLCLDEADQISNINSLRTNAVLSTFRRLKYKLLCSGTNIRNNLSEFKTALDLMYNNSINMLSTSEYIYITNKEGELEEELNPYYNKPIPPYKEGFNLYTSMFNPHKTTMLGISKFNQDIYSKDELKKIIDKTLLIRTLKDITGRDLYNITQVPCKFSENEKNLYIQILEEFNSMIEYHIKTGNSRKDSYFRILAQLNTLLKSCSTPQTFKEYTGGTPTKFIKTFRLLDKYKNEKVAIGCTRIKTVQLYAQEIRKRYPDRELFIITGNETTLKQRRNIVEQLKNSNNGILLSTVQSLSCSVSIGFVGVCIITENLYNDSSMQQYRARFSRYNSDDVTQIYNLFMKDSIEANLMKLILAKETLCNFMKNESIEEEEIFEKFGIDSRIFNCLMTKEKDHEGNVRITWGEQKVI